MAEVSERPQESQAQARKAWSCFPCRARKLKCDRLWPCERCSQSGEECRFPEARQRPVNGSKRPRVKELAARLHELELRLQQGTVYTTILPQLHTPPPPDTQLMPTGRLEQMPSQSVVDELTSLYFSKLYSQAPMQEPTRYLASLHLPLHMQPPMCLQYVILALAASLSSIYRRLAETFYQRARNYIQIDEMKGDGQYVLTLGHAQCWVLLANFEAQHLWFSRASLSVSRSVRISQMLGLHKLDTASGVGQGLALPRDRYEMEEARRTFWTIFCADRLASSTTGSPVLMDSRYIKTFLPASEAEKGVINRAGEASITLHQALRDDTVRYSPFTCRVLVAHLFHECLDHIFGNHMDHADELADKNQFWSRHMKLEDRLAIMFMVLPDSLRCPDNTDNDDAVFVSLQLYTATILLHRARDSRAEIDAPDKVPLPEAEARLLAIAHEIFGIVAVMKNVDALFLNPFVGFAAFMAAQIFLQDITQAQNKQSAECLGLLANLMIVIANQNPMTASLVVHLAQELHKSGVDKSILIKVDHLISKTNPLATLLAQSHPTTGEVLFCPL